MQYGSIFFITMIVCLAGAAIALFLGGRQDQAQADGDDDDHVHHAARHAARP
jgi:hypothetical protein